MTEKVSSSWPKQGILRDGIFIKRVPSYYTPSQISQWLSCIEYPVKFSDAEIAAGAFPATLENIEELMQLHLVAFPFEFTSIHYTPSHLMDVSPAGVFNRLVIDRQGSYCYGQNGLFLGMLRGLGYRAYGGAARVNRTMDLPVTPNFTSLSHMVIFVQPFENSNVTYVVDVGFGSSGLVRPILLSDHEDNTVIGTNLTEKHRLHRGAHPLSSLAKSWPDAAQADTSWHLEVHHSKGNNNPGRWRLLFSFSESESFPLDYENASLVICTKHEGLFWNHVVCSKYAYFDEGDKLSEEELVLIEQERLRRPAGTSRKFMYKTTLMGKEIKRHVGSSSVTIRTVATELERIQALREIFKLDIPDDAQIHIRGRNAALEPAK